MAKIQPRLLTQNLEQIEDSTLFARKAMAMGLGTTVYYHSRQLRQFRKPRAARVVGYTEDGKLNLIVDSDPDLDVRGQGLPLAYAVEGVPMIASYPGATWPAHPFCIDPTSLAIPANPGNPMFPDASPRALPEADADDDRAEDLTARDPDADRLPDEPTGEPSRVVRPRVAGKRPELEAKPKPANLPTFTDAVFDHPRLSLAFSETGELYEAGVTMESVSDTTIVITSNQQHTLAQIEHREASGNDGEGMYISTLDRSGKLVDCTPALGDDDKALAIWFDRLVRACLKASNANTPVAAGRAMDSIIGEKPKAEPPEKDTGSTRRRSR